MYLHNKPRTNFPAHQRANAKPFAKIFSRRWYNHAAHCYTNKLQKAFIIEIAIIYYDNRKLNILYFNVKTYSSDKIYVLRTIYIYTVDKKRKITRAFGEQLVASSKDFYTTIIFHSLDRWTFIYVYWDHQSIWKKKNFHKLYISKPLY